MGEPGGSTLFETYEGDYNTISNSLSRKINSQIPSLSGEAKKEAIRAAQREIEEADELIDQMDVELRSLPQATRARLQPRFRNYKSDLAKLKKDFNRVSVSATADRDELFSGAGDLETTSADQRQRLLKANQRLTDSTSRLQDSHRLAAESEEIGTGILKDLHGQREQIIRTRDNLDKADENIDTSSRILRGMSRRIQTNKFITALIIIVLLAIIGVIIYLAVR